MAQKIIVLDITPLENNLFNIHSILMDKQEGCLFRKHSLNRNIDEIKQFIEEKLITECIKNNCYITFENNNPIHFHLLKEYTKYLVNDDKYGYLVTSKIVNKYDNYIYRTIFSISEDYKDCFIAALNYLSF